MLGNVSDAATQAASQAAEPNAIIALDTGDSLIILAENPSSSSAISDLGRPSATDPTQQAQQAQQGQSGQSGHSSQSQMSQLRNQIGRQASVSGTLFNDRGVQLLVVTSVMPSDQSGGQSAQPGQSGGSRSPSGPSGTSPGGSSRGSSGSGSSGTSNP